MWHKVFTSPLATNLVLLEDVTWRVGDSWSQNITNQDGFQRGTCTLSGDRSYLRDWFEKGLGRLWRYETESGDTIWEGMVWALRLVDEGWEQSRSFDTFANRIRAVYDSRITGERLHAPSYSGWSEDTDSQEQFGIKENIITVGEAEATQALGYVDLQLKKLAWPGRSKTKTEASGTSLTIELRGFMETLAWRIYNDLTSGLEDSSVMVNTIVTAVGQFIASIHVETNTFDFPAYHNRDRYALSILRDLVSLGDGSDPWTIGVYEDRQLRYEPVATEVNLYWHEGSPTPVRLDGSLIDPWLIRPNDVIKSAWLLPGYTFDDDPDRDPTVLTVQEVSFKAPYGLSIIGTEDRQIEIMLNRIQKTRW